MELNGLMISEDPRRPNQGILDVLIHIHVLPQLVKRITDILKGWSDVKITAQTKHLHSGFISIFFPKSHNKNSTYKFPLHIWPNSILGSFLTLCLTVHIEQLNQLRLNASFNRVHADFDQNSFLIFRLQGNISCTEYFWNHYGSLSESRQLQNYPSPNPISYDKLIS